MMHSFSFGHPCSATRVLGAVILALLPLSILGQGGATGAVQGIVRDQTGAVVTNATVQIVDSSTNLSREAHWERRKLYRESATRGALQNHCVRDRIQSI